MNIPRWFFGKILTLIFPFNGGEVLSSSYVPPNDESGIWMHNADKSTLPPKDNEHKHRRYFQERNI